ncbi:MAG: hypothetical protein ACLGHT_03565 [Acidimicrobiia bacterium]
MRRAFDWLFRDRRNGGITIWQFPNAPLFLYLVASAARLVLKPEGDAANALSVAATASLVWWAVDEVVRGVNPFRRLLGAAVLASVLVRAAPS